MALGNPESERALAAWGMVRSRFHFAAREARGRTVEVIATDDPFDGAGILSAAGALSVRLSHPDRLDVDRVERSDVVVCLYPSSLSLPLSRLRTRAGSQGLLFVDLGTVAGHSAEDLTDADFFRQRLPAVYGHRNDDLRIKHVGPIGWLRFLVLDAFNRLFFNRGLVPGEYDFSFEVVPGPAGASLARVPARGEV